MTRISRKRTEASTESGISVQVEWAGSQAGLALGAGREEPRVAEPEPGGWQRFAGQPRHQGDPEGVFRIL